MQGGREVIQFLQCSAWIISTLKKLAVKERKERDCHVKKNVLESTAPFISIRIMFGELYFIENVSNFSFGNQTKVWCKIALARNNYQK